MRATSFGRACGSCVGLALLCLAALAPNARAGSITFSSATDIAGDSDVSTSGTLVAAYHFAGAATQVNGVNFDAFAIPGGASSYTVGNFTLENVDSFQNIDPATTGTWQSLSSNYTALLGTAADIRADRQTTLEMAGLTVGKIYQLQVWVNDALRDAWAVGFNTSVSDGNGNDQDLQPGSKGDVLIPAPQLPGQFVTGTFTADATTQSVYFGSGEIDGVVNAVQLRQVDGVTAAAPTPTTATAGLALLAGVMALKLRRRGVTGLLSATGGLI